MLMATPRHGLILGLFLACAAVPAARAGAPPGGLDRHSREKVLAAAREIDRLVDDGLAEHKIAPNPALDDASFARRVYLDLVGRIPTGPELSEFLASSAADRREALIDRLLLSPGYASHLFNWVADLLRVKTNLTNNVSGEPYIHFIKESIASGKPWDVFVRELLTASGPAHKRGNGATGYYLRDRGMPEDNMSNTITVFLGTRLECAQCHNHPFDTWTQMQYHQMVAFTGGMKFTDDTFESTPEGRRFKELAAEYKDPKGRSNEVRALKRVIQPLEYGISGSGTGLYRLPKDYKYEDGDPNQIVKAKTMFGADVVLAADAEKADLKDPKKNAKNKKAPDVKAPPVNSREAYAKWLASPENPRFTTVIANRLWKRFFGRGVIEPVDNLKDSTRAVNPALMKHLEATMVAVGFDLRQFIRVLANSKAYQREACRKEPSEDDPFRFPGPLLRRMSAEQLWDSMLTLVVSDLDADLQEPAEGAEPVYLTYDRIAKLPDEQVKQMVELEVLKNTNPAKFKEVRAKMAAEVKENPELQKKLEDLKDRLKAARKKGDEAEALRIREEMKTLEASSGTALMGNPKKVYKKGSGPSGLHRASDLQQPAPPGHFLREFGQADREQIEASHTQSTAPQALMLLNGFVDKTLLPNAKAALLQSASAAKDAGAKVDAIFRGILSRDAAASEKELWAADLGKRGDAALKDLVWTLVNTHEFMFIR
jgi:hypothetical protein